MTRLSLPRCVGDNGRSTKEQPRESPFRSLGKTHLMKRRDHGDTTGAWSDLYSLRATSVVPPPGVGGRPRAGPRSELRLDRPAGAFRQPSRRVLLGSTSGD